MQSPSDRGDGSSDAPAGGSCWANVATLCVSLLLAILTVEIGFRATMGLPIVRFANWRINQVLMFNLSELKAIADPVLGWTTKPWSHHDDGYNTIDYGIRQNFGETTIRTGAVLAVGDSFTEGWEVKDHESWPAYLEKFTNAPVVNAGTGGYGADQIILRAEQLLPIVKPKILVVGIYDEDIVRAGYSVFGAPKPYFTIANGEAHYHPPKFAETRPHPGILWSAAYSARDVLGYSAAADHIMARLYPNFWYGSDGNDLYRKADNHEAAVTCALLQRLKAQTARQDIRLMLFLQYSAMQIVTSDRIGPNSRIISACAQAAGIRVVDQFAPLREEIVRASPNFSATGEYYWYHGWIYGHMTAKGNAHAASLIAPALRDWLPEIPGWTPRSHASPATAPTSDGTGGPQP